MLCFLSALNKSVGGVSAFSERSLGDVQICGALRVPHIFRLHRINTSPPCSPKTDKQGWKPESADELPDSQKDIQTVKQASVVLQIRVRISQVGLCTADVLKSGMTLNK